MKNIYNVVLTLEDTKTGKEITRAIDKLNAYKSGSVCWELGTKSEQEKALKRWISERGNEQHATKLKLIDWHFV